MMQDLGVGNLGIDHKQFYNSFLFSSFFTGIGLPREYFSSTRLTNFFIDIY